MVQLVDHGARSAALLCRVLLPRSRVLVRVGLWLCVSPGDHVGIGGSASGTIVSSQPAKPTPRQPAKAIAAAPKLQFLTAAPELAIVRYGEGAEARGNGLRMRHSEVQARRAALGWAYCGGIAGVPVSAAKAQESMARAKDLDQEVVQTGILAEVALDLD
jgi:hypothetical protein|eukprot:COSAG01_NODE_480_length_16473_cov_655.154208_10_plen_160_part_00